MAILYIIDNTSRMYGYPIEEGGLDVAVNGEKFTVTEDSVPVEAIEKAITEGESITIRSSIKGLAIFSGSHLIGVQLHKDG